MKVILVSHGSFSKGLFETMEMVLGEQQNLSYVGLYPHQGVDILKENIENEFKKQIRMKKFWCLPIYSMEVLSMLSYS